MNDEGEIVQVNMLEELVHDHGTEQTREHMNYLKKIDQESHQAGSRTLINGDKGVEGERHCKNITHGSSSTQGVNTQDTLVHPSPQARREAGAGGDLRANAVGPLGSMEGSPPHTDETGGYMETNEDASGTVPMSKPLSWSDSIHEADGGDDEVGPRPQNGQSIFQEELCSLMVRHGCMEAWDDVSVKQLDAVMVAAARRTEMEYFEKLGVYERVPREHQTKTGGKVITTRWLDVNKGDAQSPEYRSRLVGQEYRKGADDALYAATPPLEALRAVLSYAAAHNKDDEKHSRKGRLNHVMINDVRRAFFLRARAKIHLF